MDLLRYRWIMLSLFCVYLLRPTSSTVLFTPDTAVLFPGGNVTFTCNETDLNRLWIINDTVNRRTDDELLNIDGVSSNGLGSTMLIITQSANNTLYGCAILQNGEFISDTGIVYVANAPDKVPGVMVITDSILLDDNNVTFTLSWVEPFNNFDPIMSYTVSCSGSITCPPNYTITDSTTRSYTITNLTPVTNYTFSVVATNSFDSGEAGVLNITAPSLPDSITGFMLMCEVIDQINQCTVQWDPIIVGNPLEQPLVYEVNYNGTMQNVTSPNTALTFTVPSLPDGVFDGSITVTVTAINKFGRGIPNDPEYAVIMSTSVSDAQVIMITPENAINSTYSIAVNCTINPASRADMCEVTATANDQTLTETAAVTNGMATVKIDGLACGITYTIIAGGTLNGDLVGPRSSYGTTTGPCPPMIITTIAATTSMTGTVKPPILSPTASLSQPPTGASTRTIVGGVVGGICGLILLALIIIPLCWCCIRDREKSSRQNNVPVASNNIPLHDSIQDYVVSDKVKMEPNPAYQGIPSDQVKMETNPAYQSLASDKGLDPAYQELSSHSGRASISEQKPANYYEDIIHDLNITMTKNPSYAVP